MAFTPRRLMRGASSTPAAAATVDARFNYVTTLLHGDGTNGAQNNTFLDSSSNNFTITRNGTATQGSFSPYGSNWSNFFDGSGDYLATSSTQIIPASTTYTVEAWVYLTGDYSDYREIVTQGSSGNANRWLMVVNITDGILIIQTGASGITTSFTVPRNTWTHLAFVNNSGSYTVYANGTSVGSGTNTVTPQNTYVTVGAFQSGAEYFQGYISNVRITNTAVYTSAFTPSTTPLTAISGTSFLTCQSNRFIDNSTNAFAITVNGNPSVQRFNPFGTSTAYDTSVIGGSAYIDENGYLGCGSQTAYALGTGDFTINAWIYNTSRPTYLAILDTRGSGGSPGWALAMNSDGTIYFYSSVTFSFVVTSAVGAIPLNSWNYVTVTRTSGTNRLYLNGVLVNTASNSDNYSHTTLTCGYSAAGGVERYYGYICDAQVIKGTAVAPTLPTAPVATSAGTSVLLNMQNGPIFDNTMMNNLVTVDNAQISTSVKKYGTGSLSFDGTGDWIRSFDKLSIAFGSGNFTVEGWIYLNNVSATKGIMFGLGDNSFGIRVGQSYLGNVNGLNIVRSGILDLEYCAFTFATGTWYHIAVVRSGTTIYFFVNGTQQTTLGSGGGSYNFATPTTGFIIGANNDTNEKFNGYIDDFRITKGYARYTANFTPPTEAFFNTGPY